MDFSYSNDGMYDIKNKTLKQYERPYSAIAIDNEYLYGLDVGKLYIDDDFQYDKT